MARKRKRKAPLGPVREPQQRVAGQPRYGARWQMLLPLLVVIAGVMAYWNSFDGAFVLDDDQHIVRNERIRDLSNLGEMLTTQRPLVEISLAVNYAIGELEVWGYHFFNVVVHLLAGLTLFGLVRRTLLLPRCRQRYGEGAAWFALAVALLWVVHPLQTQAVTYVIQRGESMMALFYLLILYCLVRGFGSSHARWWYAAAAVSAGLGMGCKAIIITAPAVAILYDRTYLAGSFAEVVRRRRRVHLAVCAAVLVVGFTIGIVPQVLRKVSGPITSFKGALARAQIPTEYLATQPAVVLHYLKLTVWPRDLCLDYKWRPAKTSSEIIPPTLAIAVLLSATGWGLWRRPGLGFLGAWFFIILAPTSTVWTLELAFEHRMYLSLAAVAVIVVLAGHAVISFFLRSRSLAGWIGNSVAATLVVAVVAALGYRTSVRNRDYESRLTMNLAVVALRPDNDRAHYNVANALSRAGDKEEAILWYIKTLDINPRHADARVNMALCHANRGNNENAIAEYRLVLEISPRHAKGLYNFGNALFNHGVNVQSQGLSDVAATAFDEAIDIYRRSLKVRPRHARSFRGLGYALHRVGDYKKAETVLRRSLELEPGNARALRTLGYSLYRLGEYDFAEDVLREALQIEPDSKWARTTLEQVGAAR